MSTTDQHTEEHRSHKISANAIGYVVHDPEGQVIHTVVDKSHSAPLTNLQRGKMWVDNKLGVEEFENDDLEGTVAEVVEQVVDSDQKIAS